MTAHTNAQRALLLSGAAALAGCMLQQPLPRNQQPVIGTPAAGRPNLNPVLSPTVIQDDATGRPPESLNSLPPGSEVNRPLTPQAGQINNVRVGPPAAY